jgi:hypothetical protein
MELLQRELIRANEEMMVWEREHDWVSMRNELPALTELDELFEILWNGVDEDYKRCQQAIQGSSSDVGASVDRYQCIEQSALGRRLHSIETQTTSKYSQLSNIEA